jgi:hypothetical protein
MNTLPLPQLFQVPLVSFCTNLADQLQCSHPSWAAERQTALDSSSRAGSSARDSECLYLNQMFASGFDVRGHMDVQMHDGMHPSCVWMIKLSKFTY